MLPVYKGKGDTLVCGSYRAIKLQEQPIKVLERVLEKRILCQLIYWNDPLSYTTACHLHRNGETVHAAE